MESFNPLTAFPHIFNAVKYTRSYCFATTGTKFPRSSATGRCHHRDLTHLNFNLAISPVMCHFSKVLAEWAQTPVKSAKLFFKTLVHTVQFSFTAVVYDVFHYICHTFSSNLRKACWIVLCSYFNNYKVKWSFTVMYLILFWTHIMKVSHVCAHQGFAHLYWKEKRPWQFVLN